jgi:HD-GYP domain-containing protein (c-di-GMP phosphodiesterase class II)
VAAVFYAALLQHIGCTAYSHEVSALFADEFSIKLSALTTDFTRPHEVALGYLPRIMIAAGSGERIRTLRSAVLHSSSMTRGYQAANCETAAMIARRLALPVATRSALLDNFEWWNGGGGPRGLQGEEISLVARIVNVAGYAVLFDRMGGSDLAEGALRQRSGGYLDPDLVAAFLNRVPGLLAWSEAGDVSDRLLAAEPRPLRHVGLADELDDVLRVFGEAVDLKAPFLHGHCTAVAELVDGASHRLGLDAGSMEQARRAALVQDIGRVAVPTSIWEHAGPLGRDAWQQVRLHPYHSEQILSRCALLAGIARLAGDHHERLDGSGYHRGSRAAQLPMVARVLAAADVYQALISERPHRQAHTADRAARMMRQQVDAGRLDGDAVQAVIAAASGISSTRRTRPHGLTDRQLEVLRLLAAGMSNRRIGEQLVISPRTAERHVQDLYTRIGVSSRAAATMFALEHGLL